MSEAQLIAERTRYVAEAKEQAARLEERARREPPSFNPPSGLPGVDALVWFKYVHATID
jgi:hypothetical protein